MVARSRTGSPPGSGGTPVGSGGMGGGQGGTSVVADAGQDATVDKRAMDLIELKDALKSLHGFTYTDPCKFSNNGSDVTTLAGCNTSDICWATMDLAYVPFYAQHLRRRPRAEVAETAALMTLTLAVIATTIVTGSFGCCW